MDVPEEAVAVSRKGEREARVLKGLGRFVMYEYETLDGKKVGKYSILLEKENGEVEHLIIIPLKGRELVVSHKREKGKVRGIWDKEKKRVIRFPPA